MTSCSPIASHPDRLPSAVIAIPGYRGPYPPSSAELRKISTPSLQEMQDPQEGSLRARMEELIRETAALAAKTSSPPEPPPPVAESFGNPLQENIEEVPDASRSLEAYRQALEEYTRLKNQLEQNNKEIDELKARLDEIKRSKQSPRRKAATP